MRASIEASKCSQILSPMNSECYLLWEKGLRVCNQVKDHVIKRQAWIILVDPACNHKCLYKKEAGGDREEGRQCSGGREKSRREDAMPLALKMEEGALEPTKAKNAALDARKAKKELSYSISGMRADLWTP